MLEGSKKGNQMSMQECKHCGSENYVKNGMMQGKQRYLCKSCKRTYTIATKNQGRALEKQLAVILYGSGKASFRFLGRLFQVCPATIMNWIKAYTAKIEEPVVADDLEEIEIDEMWHFLFEKKENYGSLRPLIEKAERLLHGVLAEEIKAPLEGYTIN